VGPDANQSGAALSQDLKVPMVGTIGVVSKISTGVGSTHMFGVNPWMKFESAFIMIERCGCSESPRKQI
jgi:hypothetical protein